jgi:hypothetical protein
MGVLPQVLPKAEWRTSTATPKDIVTQGWQSWLKPDRRGMVSCTLGPTDHAIAPEALQLRNPPNGMPDLRPSKISQLCGSRKVNKAGPLGADADGAVNDRLPPAL